MEVNPTILLSVCIPVIGALIGFAIAWGAHGQKIKNNREDINELKNQLTAMDDKLDDIQAKVARIDGRLNGKYFRGV